MKNIVAYVRVSHEEQVKYGFSLDAQKDALQEWADENGYKISEWYIDEGVSARKKIKNRPEMQRLLNDVERGGIDLIVFIKLDRFFRSVAEYYAAQEILERNRTYWKAIQEDYDTTTTDGRFRVNIMLSIAEQEADRTSDRIKFTNAHKIRKKQPISGSQPFGYTIGVNEDGEKRVIIDENAAEDVRAIFSHFLQYNSISGVTKYILDARGIKIKYNSMKKILKNPYYYGHYNGVDDYCPAYITKGTFDKIQIILKNKNLKTPQTRRVYLFSGLMSCPECGNNLVGQFLRKNGAGEDYLVYRCQNNRRQKHCGFKKCVLEHKLEKWLLDSIRPELEKYIAEVEIDAPAAAPVADRAEVVAEMDRLNYLFQKNRIKLDAYEKQYEELENKLAEIDTAEPVKMDVSALREFLKSDILDLYGEISRHDKRAAWRSIIDKIAIDENGNYSVNFLR